MYKYSYGVMASGHLGLTCLASIHARQPVQFVLTDKKSVEITAFCTANHIPCFAGNPRSTTVDAFLEGKEIDVLLSVNYLFIIEERIISLPKKMAVNFHGSLLPKYRGRTPHVWAIINGETEVGITAHLIDTGCDTGDIIAQVRVPLDEKMTGGDVLEAYKEMYPSFVGQVTHLIETDQVNLVKQDENAATYFGKRTPEDGLLDWGWQKKRIMNWVRALARPYPGAFSFYEGEKVIIHSVEYTDLAFSDEQQNGLIIAGGSVPAVKTPDGVVKLTSIETNPNLNFKTGSFFHA